MSVLCYSTLKKIHEKIINMSKSDRFVCVNINTEAAH